MVWTGTSQNSGTGFHPDIGGRTRTHDAIEGEQSEGTLRSSPAFLSKTAIATAETPW